MSAPTFTAQLGLPDPSATPLTVTDLVNLLNALFLPISVNGFNAQIITGSATPGVSDQDKLWFKTDISGNPLGFYVFNSGTWRPVYTARIGEITMFAGDPNGIFDATGKGIVGTPWDGWALCNGQNGTPDIRNRFPVGYITNVAGQLQTNFNTLGTTSVNGGALPANYTIVESDLPTYNPLFQGAEYDAGSSQPVNHFIIDNKWLNYPEGINAPNSGNTNYGAINAPGGIQTAIPIVPPYYCVAFVQFKGF